MIVVIDGPAGSGKSSTARAIAEQLNIQFLDSGALYRVATLIYLQSKKNRDLFFDRLKESNISFHFKNKKFHCALDGTDVSERIREMDVSENVSEIASDSKVRAYVNHLMREVVKKDAFIADGRDLGTAVFPDAELKFFMVADLDKRAQRRFEELQANGTEATLEEIKNNLSSRDEKDSSRKADPLRKAEDAIEVDTSEMTFDEQVQVIKEQVRQILPKH